jgi:hypothetical protein
VREITTNATNECTKNKQTKKKGEIKYFLSALERRRGREKENQERK